MILDNIERVERGEDPIGTVREPDINEPFIPIRRGSTYHAFKQGVDDETYGGVRETAAVGGAR